MLVILAVVMGFAGATHARTAVGVNVALVYLVVRVSDLDLVVIVPMRFGVAHGDQVSSVAPVR